MRIARWLAATTLLLHVPLTHAEMPFSECIESMRLELPNFARVRADSFDQFTRDAQDLRPLIAQASGNQPEFELKIWDYLAKLVDEQRIGDGRAVLAQQARALDRIAATHGVDPATVVAVMGVESDFGRQQGRHKVIDATLSRACLKMSSRERKTHFFSALWLLQQGLVKADRFQGSWAGAFGMTQFMPGTHTQYMADGDNDGVIDTVDNITDALATTANYLKGLGWSADLPWAIEVNAPPEIARQQASSEREHLCLGRSKPSGACRTFAEWAALGVSTVDGRPLSQVQTRWPSLRPDSTTALLAPAGAAGPVWLLTKNFHAIWQYNRADAYALAIGQLSAALRGEMPQRTAWSDPAAAQALSRAGFSTLQTLLRDAGRCDVKVDGYDGVTTREALASEERRRGWTPTGQPTTSLVERMRADPADPSLRCPT